MAKASRVAALHRFRVYLLDFADIVDGQSQRIPTELDHQRATTASGAAGAAQAGRVCQIDDGDGPAAPGQDPGHGGGNPGERYPGDFTQDFEDQRGVEADPQFVNF